MLDEKAIIFKVRTCTEDMGVYAAGISVKVGAHYPGRSHQSALCYRHREVAGGTVRGQPRAY